MTSAKLQMRLEECLRVRMARFGSPEYALTWKRWDMPSGEPICALRAAARRTSGNGFTGWPTPTASIVTEQDLAQAMTAGNGSNRKDYRESAILSGWPGPRACDGDKGTRTEGGALSRPARFIDLPTAAMLSGWPTAAARDWKDGRSNQHGKNARPLNEVVELAGWVSPAVQDHSRGIAPPRPHDTGIPLSQQVSGLTIDSSNAATERPEGYRLNPLFSLWLQGYPAGWACLKALETPSTPE